MRLRVAVLIVAGLLCYSNALSTPFMFDDENAIVSNAQIRQLWPLSVPLSPPRDTPVAGRPLVNLTLAINYAITGSDTSGFHLGNLAIHLLAGLALFGVVRRTLASPKLAGRFRASSVDVAFACALLWMIHPLQTEAVDYISARSEALMGLMCLLTLYCSIRALEAQELQAPRNRAGERRWVALAVSACAAGMAAKESMVVAPVLVLLYDRVFRFDSWREMLRRRAPLYVGLAATWSVLALLMLSRPRTSVGFEAGTPVLTYFLNQCEMVVRYLGLVVWPYQRQVLDYGLPRAISLGDVWPQMALLVTLGLATLWALVYRPLIGALGAWFFITLAPTSSIVPIATEVGAERRMYLPLVALIVLAVVSVAMLLPSAEPSSTPTRGRKGKAQARAPERLAYAGAVMLACAAIALATGTVLRNAEYASRLTMARTIVERWPNGRGHFTLGTLLIEIGDHDAGMRELEQSAADYPPAHFAIGTELAGLERWQDAAVHLREFIRARPQDAAVVAARELLGRSLLAQGQFDAAADIFTQVLATVPEHTRAHMFLGDIRAQQQRWPEAVSEYGAAVDRQPTSAELLARLGMALASAGRIRDAIPILERGVAAAPSNPTLHDALGHALASQGRFADAVVHFRRLVELQPSNGDARGNLARAEQLAAGKPDPISSRH